MQLKPSILFCFAIASLLSTTQPQAASSDDKMSKLILGMRSMSASSTSQLPAISYQQGLAGFLKANQLVITHAEGNCSFVKPGVCQLTAYMTRQSYPKHRPNDKGAFCGSMATWESPEKSIKKWTPTNGLAQHIANGDNAFALLMIDEKNSSFCK